jgi:hypothetical protein
MKWNAVRGDFETETWGVARLGNKGRTVANDSENWINNVAVNILIEMCRSVALYLYNFIPHYAFCNLSDREHSSHKWERIKFDCLWSRP